MLRRNFDRGLLLISKLPPAAGQLWEASTMRSAPLTVVVYSDVPPLCTMYTSMHLHPFNTSYQAYLHVLPIYHVPCLPGLFPRPWEGSPVSLRGTGRLLSDVVIIIVK